MRQSTQLLASRSHRILGMLATVPIVAWILSSFVLHGVGLALPAGLQGEYELQSRYAQDIPLEAEGILPPSEVLRHLAEDGIGRIYWLKLEQLAGRAVYVAKPGPFELEQVFDAYSGERLGPLSDEMLRAVAAGELVGTHPVALQEDDQFNRYYTVDRVAAVAVELEGDQPAEIVFSRASGRVLRRTGPLAAWFEKAYRTVHIWQWGDSLLLFTAVLYGLAGVSLVLVGLGYTLWWVRRKSRSRWTKAVRPARRVHGRLAPIAGFLLATQMLVGAYLWFNLGLIEPRFRGQGSFETEWSGGISTSEQLESASVIAQAIPADLQATEDPIQRYEWRAVADDRFWIAYPDRATNGILLNAGSGEVLDRLTPEQAGIAGASVVQGEPSGPAEESVEYWMDYNERVPTYLFRFTDPDDTDIHVSQITGEIVQRRPAVWRAFSPFLLYHTFGFTGNPWLDTLLLSTLQISILVMVGTGWALALRKKKKPRVNPSE
jgi:hypothetical protein